MQHSGHAQRSDRLTAIAKILKDIRVESQEELLDRLETLGIMVTQATLSRDLKSLKASKVGNGNHGYFYALPSEDELQRREGIYANDIIRGYVSIDWNESTVVIKTYSGHSAPMALAIDNMRIDCVLGTLAGQDNTVFVALKRGATGEDFVRELSERVPGLDIE